jgi:hypothetical protein
MLETLTMSGNHWGAWSSTPSVSRGFQHYKQTQTHVILLMFSQSLTFITPSNHHTSL